ncbi:hypothetical protein V6N13_110739 [Hibiscus sabdariffa]
MMQPSKTWQHQCKTEKNQIGKLANALSNRPQGALPSDTEDVRQNHNEQCKVVTLRNGKQCEAETSANQSCHENEPVEDPNDVEKKEVGSNNTGPQNNANPRLNTSEHTNPEQQSDASKTIMKPPKPTYVLCDLSMRNLVQVYTYQVIV